MLDLDVLYVYNNGSMSAVAAGRGGLPLPHQVNDEECRDWRMSSLAPGLWVNIQGPRSPMSKVTVVQNQHYPKVIIVKVTIVHRHYPKVIVVQGHHWLASLSNVTIVQGHHCPMSSLFKVSTLQGQLSPRSPSSKVAIVEGHQHPWSSLFVAIVQGHCCTIKMHMLDFSHDLSIYMHGNQHQQKITTLL